MPESPVIIKDQALSPAEDFQFLRQEGIQLIEQLASRRWTDYNTHDPGITLLEALCYAITDLGYRTSFELKDLLTRSEQGAAYSVGKFHTAAEIMSCYPVTFDDLRKILMDIRGVRQAFVHPVATPKFGLNAQGCLSDSASPEAFSIQGLYEVCLEFEENVLDLRTGLRDLSSLSNGQGNFLAPEGQGIFFTPQRNLWLRSVAVYPANPGDITLQLWGPDGNLLYTWSRHLPLANEKNTLSLEVPVPYDYKHASARYRLTATGETGCPWLFSHHEPGFPIQLPGYVSLEAGDPDSDTNYFFYDWEWDTSPDDEKQGVWKHARVGESDYATFPSDYVQPETHSMLFDVETDLTLDALYVFVNKKGFVAISLLDESGSQLYRHEFEVKDTLCKLRVPLCWEIPACQGYRLVAESDPKVELILNPQAAFPYFIEGVVYLLGEPEGALLTQQYAFFYDWEISWLSVEKNKPDNLLTKGSIRREARRRILAHRNLCEDLADIGEVTTEEVGIQATIHLTSEADVDLVMAKVFVALETYVKPPVFFYTLQQMQEKGYTTDQIFEGPLLEHGFIDPAEFKAAKDRTELRASDILNLLMDIPGVKAIKGFSMEAWEEGVMRKTDPWFLCLDADVCRVPNFSKERSCLSFYRDGIALRTDKLRVKDFLEEEQLLTVPFRLRGHDTDLPVPVGQDRQVGENDPMQHELPGIYQVGRFLTPDSRPPLRKAQARQLKAYLQFFEQILANYLAQLDQFPQLLNWESQQPIRTYFTQTADQEIAEIERIYVRYEDLEGDLSRIIEGDTEALTRRNRFLDHLAGRFSESFTDYSLLMFHLFNRNDATLLRVIRDKEAFLRHYPALSARRGQGIDYRTKNERPLMGGFQQRMMALLGMRTGELHPTSQPYQLRYDDSRGWQLVLLGKNEWGDDEVWFESRFTEGQDIASGLFALIVRHGQDKENYSFVTTTQADCEQNRWQLDGPCTGEASQPLGWIPGSTTEEIDRLTNWLANWKAPAPAAPEPDTAWPDLASDAFAIRKTDEDWYFVVLGENDQVLFESAHCQSESAIEQLLDAATSWGASVDHYRLEAETCGWVLEKICTGEETSVFGRVVRAEYLQVVLDAFRKANLTEGLHVLEHLLLRPRQPEGPFLLLNSPAESPISAQPDPYSFQATVILPSWSERNQRLPYRKLVEDLLRREAPAHVFLHVYWLNYTQMQRFEHAYQSWMAELALLPAPRNGAHPFPVDTETAPGNLPAYQEALRQLLHVMACFHSVYPPARTYDPNQSIRGEEPMLGRMSLKAM